MDSGNCNPEKVEKRSDSNCLADLNIENVVVYLEKAEITRSIRYEICEGQTLECTFEQLPSSIDRDSIRIEVPNNLVSIQDVTFNVRPVNEASEQRERLIKIKELIREEKQSQGSLQAKRSRFLKQKCVLDAFANTLIKGNTNNSESCTVDALNVAPVKTSPSSIDAYNPNYLETIGHFFQLYNDSGERFDENLLDIDRKLQQSAAKITSLEGEIRDIEIRQDEELYRELFVTIEGRIDGEFEMNISYVVGNCSWRPMYDVRVSNSTGSMQINYYGVLKQKCGEDWYQTSTLSLSTAEPGIGGTVPEIGLQKVQFKTSFINNQEVPPPQALSPVLSTPNVKRSSSRYSSFRKSRAPSFNVFDFNTVNGSTTVVNNTEAENPRPTDNKSEKDRSINKQTNSMGSSFEVARPPSLVTCDNTEYHVMIAVIYLEPHYQHVTVPKYSPYAYLRSISTNSSKYTLLEGPVNIYIDSNFIGKTQLPTVCPCEDFHCNLGVDKGIKIGYLPMFKYKETSAKSTCVTFKQEIQVINNHERPIRILVIDQLPVSSDEKIKVTLLEPGIKNLEKYDKSKPIRINPNRQIEWDCEIGSKDKKEMVLKFSVEHPHGRDIEVMQMM